MEAKTREFLIFHIVRNLFHNNEMIDHAMTLWNERKNYQCHFVWNSSIRTIAGIRRSFCRNFHRIFTVQFSSIWTTASWSIQITISWSFILKSNQIHSVQLNTTKIVRLSFLINSHHQIFQLYQRFQFPPNPFLLFPWFYNSPATLVVFAIHRNFVHHWNLKFISTISIIFFQIFIWIVTYRIFLRQLLHMPLLRFDRKNI